MTITNLDEKTPPLRPSGAATSARIETTTAIDRLAPDLRAGLATDAAGRLSAAMPHVPTVATTTTGLIGQGRRAPTRAMGTRATCTRAMGVRAVIGLRVRPGTATKPDAGTVRLARRAISIGIGQVRRTVSRRTTAIGRSTGHSIMKWATAVVRPRDLPRIAAMETPSGGRRITLATADRPLATTGVTTIAVTTTSMAARRITAADQATMRRAITAIGRPITAIDVRPRRVLTGAPTTIAIFAGPLRLATATTSRVGQARRGERGPPRRDGEKEGRSDVAKKGRSLPPHLSLPRSLRLSVSPSRGPALAPLAAPAGNTRA